MTQTILVTGGAGFIGSHICVALLEAGYAVVVADNLCNSHPAVPQQVEKITGKLLTFAQGDVRNRDFLDTLFQIHRFTAVIHCAGLKAVGESSIIPLEYYDNNVSGTLVLCQAMQRYEVKTLIFSSSATVYGDPQILPIPESAPLSVTNPYGRSKLMIEQILADWYRSDPTCSVALLRYFNPIGAHSSGLIGEDPNGIPNNLLPYMTQVALGKYDKLPIYGNDFPTRDGTGIRDYLHVMDLAQGHVQAAAYLLNHKPQCNAWNLGTGQGYSVLEILRTFEEVSGKTIPYEITDKRLGDVARCFSDPKKAWHDFHWRAVYSLENMLADAWRWQQTYPEGYQSV